MSSSPVKIVGLSLIDEPSVNGKDRILASFSCEFDRVRLSGCTLMRMGSNGNVRGFPPRCERPRNGDHPGKVFILDNSLLDAITAAAHRAYQALGGCE